MSAPPVQERAQVTRDRLLAAAIDAFAREGYKAASTRRIETAAGVKRGLIAYHFGSKEALWKAAAGWMLERVDAMIAEAEEGAQRVDPAARLRFFVRSFVRICAAHPEVNRLMIREGMDDDWRLAWMIEYGSRPIYDRAKRLFDEARAAGSAPDMDFPHFFYILTGGASLIFSMAPEVRRLAGLDSRKRAVIDAHADALVAVLAPSMDRAA